MTVGEIVDRPRTAAASAARRRIGVHRLLLQLAGRLDEVSDAHLEALYGAVVEEIQARRVRP